jgi:NAD(P)H-quinone oxidoreductase subunit 5
MGFMMVQCGLAAFPAAMLHIIGHGCYKAWSFLRSGQVQALKRPAAASPKQTLTAVALGTVVAVPAVVLASWITGFSPLHSPGELALTVILALSSGQVWAALLRGPIAANHPLQRSGVAILVTFVGLLAAFTLYHLAGSFLTPVLGEWTAPTGAAAWAAGKVVVVGMIVLTVAHAFLPTLTHTAGGRAFRVHALHGFYFGAAADRLVSFIWKQPKGTNHA